MTYQDDVMNKPPWTTASAGVDPRDAQITALTTERDRLMDELRSARLTFVHYTTPGIHERWRADEAIERIDSALKTAREG